MNRLFFSMILLTACGISQVAQGQHGDQEQQPPINEAATIVVGGQTGEGEDEVSELQNVVNKESLIQHPGTGLGGPQDGIPGQTGHPGQPITGKEAPTTDLGKESIFQQVQLPGSGDLTIGRDFQELGNGQQALIVTGEPNGQGISQLSGIQRLSIGALAEIVPQLGLRVVHIIPGSKAHQLGIQRGDIIRQINKIAVLSRDQFESLLIQANDWGVGQVTLIVQNAAYGLHPSIPEYSNYDLHIIEPQHDVVIEDSIIEGVETSFQDSLDYLPVPHRPVVVQGYNQYEQYGHYGNYQHYGHYQNYGHVPRTHVQPKHYGGQGSGCRKR
ncbi:MAG TPA: PDZ domain-containing protein [Pirellulaceae bacterium]|nr:PDZ domain-containing protein [Pirellulaceae bacterium]